jgi:hypothetical protein
MNAPTKKNPPANNAATITDGTTLLASNGEFVSPQIIPDEPCATRRATAFESLGGQAAADAVLLDNQPFIQDHLPYVKLGGCYQLRRNIIII